jgi:hypothetical protein
MIRFGIVEIHGLPLSGKPQEVPLPLIPVIQIPKILPFLAMQDLVINI